MNYKIVINTLGKLLIFVAIFLLIPMGISFIYQEGIEHALAFAIPALVSFTAGMVMNIRRVDSFQMGIKDGLFITAVSWIVVSLVGCVPFLISGEIPNFFTAFFEITSGFTTTGASALTGDELDALSHSMLFWRSFSHWIGGMGILVFILGLLPRNTEYSMHILRAESPGPNVGKLVARISKSSRILYYIYIVLTLLLFGLLLLIRDPNITWFEALCYAFGTAGTGGFGTTSAGFGIYTPAAQYIVSIFMIIFGINFTLFYFLLIANFKSVVKNEEIKWYFATIIISVAIICATTFKLYDNFEETFRVSLFQTASIISTTGFSTVDYSVWPALPLCVLILLTVVGSCAGSTAGGMKQSRVILLVKRAIWKIKKVFNPRSVPVIRMDGSVVDDNMINNVLDFAILYAMLLAACALLTSIYNPAISNLDPLTAITASLTCISNVGPGLGLVGPAGGFASYSWFSKLIFSFEMMAGRLELMPMLILFNPYTYKNKNAF